MRALVLSAGKATRLEGQCKALVKVRGRRVLDWQLVGLAGYSTALVVSEPHEDVPIQQRVVPREHRGPGGALAWSVNPDWTGPLLVVYGDTLWAPQPLPEGDWIGVAKPPRLDRNWDVATERTVVYRRARAREQVCVGLYQFADAGRLRTAIDLACSEVPRTAEVGMADILRRYPVRPARVPIEGWTDVGDVAALDAANHQGVPA